MKNPPRSPNRALAPISMWLTQPLSTDVAQMIERLRRADDVAHIAIMPDVHLAGGVCVGTVLATDHLIYPQAVGADIGCGMIAMAFDGEAAPLADEAVVEQLLAELRTAVPIMRHPTLGSAPPMPQAMLDRELSVSALRSTSQHEGCIEFATLGRGNHFLEFQSDESGRLWLMIHSGSRIMGQRISEYHARSATRTRAGLHYLDASAPQGQAYLADLEWAIRYAETSRDRIGTVAAELVNELFGIKPVAASIVRCNHNHVRREEHAGRPLWVHRKGANSASDDEPGIIPGSMGTGSLIVVGRGCPQSLRSSSHGAGRAFSRHEARRRITEQQVLDQLDHVCFDRRLARQLREECPAAYKDIHTVMRAQKDLVRIVHRLQPILCYKGV